MRLWWRVSGVEVLTVQMWVLEFRTLINVAWVWRPRLLRMGWLKRLAILVSSLIGRLWISEKGVKVIRDDFWNQSQPFTWTPSHLCTCTYISIHTNTCIPYQTMTIHIKLENKKKITHFTTSIWKAFMAGHWKLRRLWAPYSQEVSAILFEFNLLHSASGIDVWVATISGSWTCRFKQFWTDID